MYLLGSYMCFLSHYIHHEMMNALSEEYRKYSCSIPLLPSASQTLDPAPEVCVTDFCKIPVKLPELKLCEWLYSLKSLISHFVATDVYKQEYLKEQKILHDIVIIERNCIFISNKYVCVHIHRLFQRVFDATQKPIPKTCSMKLIDLVSHLFQE